ncbi:hypothetical protein Tco_0839017 [Tanacetum coccineum]|uniref:Uncharacterized protein n=1 Tax=Tanacetum coccineum TaxID=301880 RepID=A0ABQ5APG3_9ASTR
MSKGEEYQKFRMSILDCMMNDAIMSSDSYLTYLALSTNTEATVPKEVKGKGKGGTGKKKVATTLKFGKSISLTEAEEQEEEHFLHDTHAHLVTKTVADTAESEEIEDEEVQPLVHGSTSVVIGREVHKKTVEGALDHSHKLKGIEILSEVALYDKGAGIIPEVPDEPKDISGSSNSSRSGSDDETKDISSDKEVKADEHKAEEGKKIEEQARNEQLVDEQAEGEQAKVHTPEPTVPNPNKTKAEIQLMVDVPIHQEDPIVQRTPLVYTVISMVTKKSTPTPPPRTTETQATLVSESDL